MAKLRALKSSLLVNILMLVIYLLRKLSQMQIFKKIVSAPRYILFVGLLYIIGKVCKQRKTGNILWKNIFFKI